MKNETKGFFRNLLKTNSSSITKGMLGFGLPPIHIKKDKDSNKNK